MARHGGFAVAASIRQSDLNSILAYRFDSAGPIFFPLPKTVNIGGRSVTFGGIARAAAPVFELHPNPQDLITGHFAFFATFSAQVDNEPLDHWKVRLDVTASARFLVGPYNGQIVLRLDTSSVNFQPLSVTFVEGPAPPNLVLAALQSPAVANAAAAVIHTLPVIEIARLAPSTFSHTQPAEFKDTNFSVFDWFTISFTVNRVVLKLFEGAITIAADFAGITNGNLNELADLTRAHGGGRIYVQTVTQLTDPKSPPIAVPTSYSSQSNLSVAFNMYVVSHLIANQVSPSIEGTPVTKEAVLKSIRVGYGKFEKPMRGNEDGLWVHVEAIAKKIVATEIDIYLQPFLRTYDGPTEFLGKDAWLILVGRVDIDLPLWAEIGIFALRVLTFVIAVVVTIPALINVNTFVPLISGLFNDLNKGLAGADPGNIAAATQLTVQNGVYDARLPHGTYVSIGPDAIDIGYGRGIEAPFKLPAEEPGGAQILPEKWSVYDRQPIQTSVVVSPGWQGLVNNNLQALWEIRRKDTNEVVLTGHKPYLTPGGNGISIPHHSQELYRVSQFVVRCTLSMTLSSQAGEIWSGETILTISDDIDRTMPFVEWGPKYVYFKNAGTEEKYWSRLSRSRIHRTAVAARCRMLRIAASLRAPATEGERVTGRYASKYMKFRYRDFLPFTWDNVTLHRKELCEYCFFGGPEKQVPYPPFDWFEPPAGTKFEKTHFK